MFHASLRQRQSLISSHILEWSELISVIEACNETFPDKQKLSPPPWHHTAPHVNDSFTTRPLRWCKRAPKNTGDLCINPDANRYVKQISNPDDLILTKIPV